MKYIELTLFALIFALGFLSANLLNLDLFNTLESPFTTGEESNNPEAPSDIISLDKIKIYDDKVIIYVNDASLSRYASTGSMKPLIDEGANGIRIKPESKNDINVGDIVSFRDNNNLIIHRVIEKGADSQGIYYITKGDNSNTQDKKIRFEDIEYITVGVIW